MELKHECRRLDRVRQKPARKEGRKEHMSTLPLLVVAELGGSSLTGNAHVGLAASGAAIGVGLIGMAASSAVGRNPGAATKILVQSILAIAFCEAIVFYALFLVK
jgi:F-type H+-transporting ATPase subunit c